MKKLLFLIVVLVVIAFLFPLSNLFYSPGTEGKLSGLRPDDPQFATVAATLEQKCSACHTAGATLPFYARFPVASDMVEQDVNSGLKHMNMLTELMPTTGQAVPEAALAKIEHVTDNGTMPPDKFVMMHWNGALAAEEKDHVLSWIGQVRQAHYATGDAAAGFQNEPVQPLPLTIDLNEEKVALGKRLYHDTRLSGDDSLSCATCHDLAKGGTDQAQFSTGIDGQVGPINSPTTFNSGYFVRQFWDGREATLEDQAGGPVHNPIEMGSSWDEVIPKLEKDHEYVAAFKSLYPDQGITGDTIVDAIATFERSLNTPNARFDQYLRGATDVLTADEIEGYGLFKSSGCATCHVGKAMGGQSFERMGLKGDYFADRGDVVEVDYGFFNFTKNEDDRFKFKVPTLRNITVTFPYFHDGRTGTLEEAVKIMSRYQEGSEFTDGEAAKVVQYLKTLTGEYDGQLLQ